MGNKKFVIEYSLGMEHYQLKRVTFPYYQNVEANDYYDSIVAQKPIWAKLSVIKTVKEYDSTMKFDYFVNRD